MIPWSHNIFCLQAAALGDSARVARGTGVRVRLHEPARKLAGCPDRRAWERRLQPTGPHSITPWGWEKWTEKDIRTRNRSWRSSYRLGKGQIHGTYFVAVVGNTVLSQSRVGSLATDFAWGWKRDFNFFWNKTKRTTTTNAESRWRGTTRLLTRVFRKHCSPCLLPLLSGAMSPTLHQTMSFGPLPLLWRKTQSPSLLTQIPPSQPAHFSPPSPERFSSYLQAHQWLSAYDPHKGFKPHSL